MCRSHISIAARGGHMDAQIPWFTPGIVALGRLVALPLEGGHMDAQIPWWVTPVLTVLGWILAGSGWLMYFMKRRDERKAEARSEIRRDLQEFLLPLQNVLE